VNRTLAAFFVLTITPLAHAVEPFEFKDGDRVVLLGGTLIEREQRYGYWETVLTALHPYKDITFRNLGWSGDTVWGEAMARFGGPAEGFRHRQQHIAALRPTVIILGFGGNEAFAGPAGLPKFEQGLNTLLDSLASTKARLVFLSPPPQENLGPPLPDPAAQNKNIRIYADVLRKAADKRGGYFVDLFDLLGKEKERLTDNGLHLTEYGYWRSADVLARALCGTTLLRPSSIELEGQPEVGACTPYFDPLPLPPRPGHPFLNQYTLSFPRLKAGRYSLGLDGQSILTAAAEDWAKGVGVPADPYLRQAERLRTMIVEKNQTYFHRWRPQNETYLFLFRKSEQGQNAKEIPEFDSYVADLEREIAKLRVFARHVYELSAAR
jgi:lysophospholipase L1-like esterase